MLTIDGVQYDVSTYAKHHPGGKLVFQNLAGRDVTEEFAVFHPKGTKVMLRGMEVEKRKSKKLDEFLELEEQMQEMGLFESTGLFYIERALILMNLFAAVWSLRCSHPVVSAVCLGMFWCQLAFIGHDVGHSSVNGRKNDLFYGTLFGNTLGGISLGWWKHSHYVHHATPNDFEKDPDIQHLPVLAVDSRMLGFYSTFHKRQFELDSIAKFLVSKQAYLFYPIMTVARFNLYAQSLAWSWPRGGLDFWCLLAFYGWFLCLAFSGPLPFMYIYVSHAVTGLLHVQICISHFAEKVLCEHVDWVDRQTLTTIDVDCPAWMDWFHGGLQFQLEHHLFPRLPREHLREASELLDPYFEKHKVRCIRLGFVKCNLRVLRKLSDVSSTALLLDAINLRG